MTYPPRNRWDMLSVGLWTLLFACGLAPEPVFYALRDAAFVASHRAFVNSSLVLTVSFAVYLALFVLRRCRESGVPDIQAQGRALQTGVLGLLAFLEFPARGNTFEVQTILELVFRFQELPGGYLRGVVLFIGLSKLVAWWYLFSLVLKYHALGKRDIFANSPTLFPSARSPESQKEPAAAHPQDLQRPNIRVEQEDWRDETRPN